MQKILVMQEIDHSQYVTVGFNEYGEEVECFLPENVQVFESITDEDLAQGQRNNYALSM